MVRANLRLRTGVTAFHQTSSVTSFFTKRNTAIPEISVKDRTQEQAVIMQMLTQLIDNQRLSSHNNIHQHTKQKKQTKKNWSHISTLVIIQRFGSLGNALGLNSEPFQNACAVPSFTEQETISLDTKDQILIHLAVYWSNSDRKGGQYNSINNNHPPSVQ